MNRDGRSQAFFEIFLGGKKQYRLYVLKRGKLQNL